MFCFNLFCHFICSIYVSLIELKHIFVLLLTFFCNYFRLMFYKEHARLFPLAFCSFLQYNNASVMYHSFPKIKPPREIIL